MEQIRVKFLKSFDLVALCSILLLIVLIVSVLVIGDRSIPRITAFSWDHHKIGVQDQAFTLQFNHQVDHNSVEKNLKIEPWLPGKFSWLGTMMTYSPTISPIYGETYQVKLAQAQAQIGNKIVPLADFSSKFQTRDRAFVYLGIDKEERGRLILYNLSQQVKNILTPPDFIVIDFKIYPEGDKILFSAFERSNETVGEQQLYTVTTGLNVAQDSKSEPMGRIKRILDAKDYQNFQFDLSSNGQTIVIGRLNRSNSVESGLWIIPEDGTPRPLGVPATEFKIAPNGQQMAVVQSKGVALVPLTPNASPLNFFPNYGNILTFSKDSSQKIMIKYNPDQTRSLFVVNNDGQETEIQTSKSPIVDCRFEPQAEQILYCLKIDIIEENNGYREEPYLTAIKVANGEEIPLLSLPNYRDVKMSMSPDGIALLFDQVVTVNVPQPNQGITESQEAIAGGRLWLIPLPDLSVNDNPTRPQPEDLLPGFNPKWLP